MTAPPAPTTWVVVDASVWVSRLVPQDVHHDVSRRWLDRYMAAGGRLVAPVMLFIEVAGAIARRTGQPTLAHQAIAHLRTVTQLHIVPVDIVVGRDASHLAADVQLRGADAIYVAVARILHIPLVTWDVAQQTHPSALIMTYTPATFTF